MAVHAATPDDLTQLGLRIARIGATPLKTLNLRTESTVQPVNLKLEGFNPGGSIKDRTAWALIRDVESRGLLKPGGAVVESTSGNLGVALAYLCQVFGYRFIAVVDPKTTQENISKMLDLGATIELVSQLDETNGYLLNRLRRVRELVASIPGAVWTNQYENPANVEAHFQTTGPEILQQMSGAIDVVLIAVSTGGTLTGASRYLRAHLPSIRVIAVDAQGSIALGGSPSKRLLTGIGASRQSSFIERADYDELIHVSDEDAFACCRALMDMTGLRVGGSSGAVLAATIGHVSGSVAPSRVVCICPDTGDNYASTIFSDDYIASALPAVRCRERYYRDRVVAP